MKLKADENLPVEVVEDLRQAGHDAVTVADQQLAGQPDGHVANLCRTEERAVLTLDLDFSDIRVYPPSDYAGIIVLRPAVQSVSSIRRLVGQVIALLPTYAGVKWAAEQQNPESRMRSFEPPSIATAAPKKRALLETGTGRL